MRGLQPLAPSVAADGREFESRFNLHPAGGLQQGKALRSRRFPGAPHAPGRSIVPYTGPLDNLGIDCRIRAPSGSVDVQHRPHRCRPGRLPSSSSTRHARSVIVSSYLHIPPSTGRIPLPMRLLVPDPRVIFRYNFQRIRKALESSGGVFSGPVEVDET